MHISKYYDKEINIESLYIQLVFIFRVSYLGHEGTAIGIVLPRRGEIDYVDYVHLWSWPTVFEKQLSCHILAVFKKSMKLRLKNNEMDEIDNEKVNENTKETMN